MEEPALYDDEIITEPPDHLAGVLGHGPLISVGFSTVVIFALFILFGMRSKQPLCQALGRNPHPARLNLPHLTRLPSLAGPPRVTPPTSA